MKHDPLTVATLLEHEAAFPRHTGRKERETRKRFGLGPARYYQALIVAITDHQREALETDPITTHRLLAQMQRTQTDLRHRRAAGLDRTRSTR